MKTPEIINSTTATKIDFRWVISILALFFGLWMGNTHPMVPASYTTQIPACASPADPKVGPCQPVTSSTVITAPADVPKG